MRNIVLLFVCFSKTFFALWYHWVSLVLAYIAIKRSQSIYELLYLFLSKFMILTSLLQMSNKLCEMILIDFHVSVTLLHIVSLIIVRSSYFTSNEPGHSGMMLSYITNILNEEEIQIPISKHQLEKRSNHLNKRLHSSNSVIKRQFSITVGADRLCRS